MSVWICWHPPVFFYSGPYPSCSSSSASRATWSFLTWSPWQQVWAWQQLSSCLGKHELYYKTHTIHTQIWIYVVVVVVVSSFPLNVVFSRSMLPDVVDDFKVRNPDIHGHEALFYSFYVFFIKFASGMSLGVSTLSLKWVQHLFDDSHVHFNPHRHPWKLVDFCLQH